MICGEHRIAVGQHNTSAEWSVGVVAVQLSLLIAVASIHRRSIVVTRTSGRDQKYELSTSNAHVHFAHTPPHQHQQQIERREQQKK